MEAGLTQGVSTPLVKTQVEKVREVRVQPGVYRMVKSFVESSLKASYPWRVAQETPVSFIWRKEGKWILEAYKRF